MARARAAKRSPAPAVPSGARSLVWLQGLLCGGLLALAPPTAILAATLLAPAALAWRLDNEPGRPVARAVLVTSLAGALPALRRLWAGNPTMAMSLAMLSDISTSLPAWIAAGAGWLLVETAPIGLRAWLDFLARHRAGRLRAERARLEAEWGIPPPDEG